MPDTITIQPWIVYTSAIAIVVSIFVPLMLTIRGKRRLKRELRQKEREKVFAEICEGNRQCREKQQQEQVDLKKQEQAKFREKLTELLPSVWLRTYEDCEASGDHSIRAIWFGAWKERASWSLVPKLPMPATKLFAEMVSQEEGEGGRRFGEALKMLTPFFQLTAPR